MSNPKPTADDHRDRLVDRVLAEALGEERPPDLSQAILQRVADAQAEAGSTSHGRGVMRSRRVWVTLLATAASLMAAAFVWQANERREAAEVATVSIDRSKEMTLKAAEQNRFETMSVDEQLAQSKSAPAPAAEVGDGPQSTQGQEPKPYATSSPQRPAIEESERRLGAARVFNRNPAVDGQSAPAISPSAKQFLERQARHQAAAASQDQGQLEVFNGVDRAAIPSVSTPAAPATQQPSSGAYGRPSASEDDLKWFEPVELGKDGQMPRRDSGWFGSIDKLYWSQGNPRVGASGQINDAMTPKNGPFGWAGGGEWPSQRYRHVPPTSHDRYEPIHENAFVKPVGEDALSTFSIDVDTASYANVRQYLRDLRQMPPVDAVRVEELVNYFEYGYEAPTPESEAPFAANPGCFACPWKPEHKLVRIGVKGREVAVDKRPLSNLVFLVDVSGSMNEENKLPLVISGLQTLVNKLGENDRVAIVVYAGSEGLVLPSTSGDQKEVIRAALDRLTAGGSTAGGAGLRLAYEIAERNKIVGGVNRVVLCTDGDFNVGMTGTEELAKFVETRAKETNVYLTVLGFGRGNLNDAMLEQISGRGDGNYAYIDDFKEAHRVLSSDLSKTLVAIAKDVKMQVEFNPAKVASYRLIGYENRVMAAEDFNNDAKDAGDIGAGHTVTALYEIVPVGGEEPAPPVDGLKYQARAAAVEDDAAHTEPTAFAGELLTLKIRYKQPEGGASKKLEFPLEDSDGKSVADADADFRWAAAVAEFGMLLRNSRHAGDGSFDAVLELARGAIGEDPQGYRAEFVDLVRRAKEVSGR